MTTETTETTERHGYRRAIGTGLGVLVALLLLGFGWLWFAPCSLGGCAPLDDLAQYQAEGSELLDIHGKPIGTLATVNRRIVSLDSLPPFLPRAFVAVEDQRFYGHSGVDFRRMLAATARNVKAGGVQEGGSTITMQLARNLFPERLPYRDRSVMRKLREIRVARQIERTFSKDKILELYLNHIYLGEGAYGVDAAARTYFAKPASQLTLAEAATLGGLPKAPSDINPVENRRAAEERRNLVLGQMVDAGFITQAEASEAEAEPVRVAKGKPSTKGPRGSYFIERVRRELEDALGSTLYTAGLKIYTTLDPVAQRASEEELFRQMDAIEAGAFGRFRHSTYPESKGEAQETGVTPYLQGAVVLIDAQSGEVRALVGGRDFEDSKFDRAYQAKRQPGSAFKPFVYLTAVERDGSPTRVVEDAPVRVTLTGGRVWEPKNYTGNYAGPMTLRDALIQSKNTVTVRLAQEMGMGPIIDNAHRLGITTEIPDVPSAALGAAEVRPIELISAYAPFANGGQRIEPHFIRKIVDRHGEVVWEGSPATQEVLTPATAFVLTTMLEDVVNRGTGSAVRAVGYRGPAAGKTGTTNDAADVWFVGYTPELVGGVWMGLDKPATIVRGASGGTLAAPVWGRIMKRVYADRPAPREWSPPAGVATAEVEAGTGQVVGATCPPRGPTYTEYFIGSAPPEPNCATAVPYVSVASTLDTAWVDQEWAIDDSLMADTFASTPPGVDWPELDALRRRIREAARTGTVAAPTGDTLGDELDGLPPLPPPQGAGPAAGAPNAPRSTPAPTRPAARPADVDPLEPPAQPAEPPRLLGVPTSPDSSSPPPGGGGGGFR